MLKGLMRGRRLCGQAIFPRELNVRIQAILRRSQMAMANRNDVLEVGSLRLMSTAQLQRVWSIHSTHSL